MDFIQNIHSVIGQDENYAYNPVKHVVIRPKSCPSVGSLNEVIDAFVEMSHPRHGLQGFRFVGFPRDAHFDEHLLKRLAKKSFNLSKLAF